MFVGHFETGAAQLFKEAVIPLKLEGLVAKRVDSVPRRGAFERLGKGEEEGRDSARTLKALTARVMVS